MLFNVCSPAQPVTDDQYQHAGYSVSWFQTRVSTPSAVTARPQRETGRAVRTISAPARHRKNKQNVPFMPRKSRQKIPEPGDNYPPQQPVNGRLADMRMPGQIQPSAPTPGQTAGMLSHRRTTQVITQFWVTSQNDRQPSTTVFNHFHQPFEPRQCITVQIMNFINKQCYRTLPFFDQFLQFPFAVFTLFGDLYLLILCQVIKQDVNQRGEPDTLFVHRDGERATMILFSSLSCCCRRRRVTVSPLPTTPQTAISRPSRIAPLIISLCFINSAEVTGGISLQSSFCSELTRSSVISPGRANSFTFFVTRVVLITMAYLQSPCSPGTTDVPEEAYPSAGTATTQHHTLKRSGETSVPCSLISQVLTLRLSSSLFHTTHPRRYPEQDDPYVSEGYLPRSEKQRRQGKQADGSDR